MLKIIFKTTLILTLAIGLCLGLDVIYRQHFKLNYRWPQNVFVKPPIKDKFQIVNVGNSHSQDGITFVNFKMRSLSLASVAQSFEYDLANLKMYANQIDKNAIIIINVSPMSFSQGKPKKNSGLQYTYYDGRLSPFVIPNLSVEGYLESQIVPFIKDASLWRQEYSKEAEQIAADAFALNWPQAKKKRAPEPIIIVATQSAQITSGEKSLLSAEQELALSPFQSDERLEESVNFMFNKWHDPKDFSPDFFDSNRQDLETMIKYCLDHQWRPVLITVPISQKLIDGLGQEYMTTYLDQQLAKTNKRGVLQIDFSDLKSFRKNAFLFSNSDHLSADGAKIFSHFLLERLIKAGYISPEQNGYIN